MGRLKIKDSAADLVQANKDQLILDKHVRGFLETYDKRITGSQPYVKAAQRIAYEAGVRDALAWVRKFNEENKTDVRQE